MAIQTTLLDNILRGMANDAPLKYAGKATNFTSDTSSNSTSLVPNRQSNKRNTCLIYSRLATTLTNSSGSST
ncbi:hypothetical protein [Spirosoma aerophilum]